MQIYFVRDVVSKGLTKLDKIPTEENLADMLTKALYVANFRHCLNLVNSIGKWKLLRAYRRDLFKTFNLKSRKRVVKS